MVSCSACGCSKTDKNVSLKITFHRFPRDENRRREWVKILDQGDWITEKNSFLCSKHFTEDCFDRSSSLIVRLQPNAVPTIKVIRMKYVRTNNPSVEQVVTTACDETLDLPGSSASQQSFLPCKESEENLPDDLLKRQLKRYVHHLETQNKVKKSLRVCQEQCDESMIKEEITSSQEVEPDKLILSEHLDKSRTLIMPAKQPVLLKGINTSTSSNNYQDEFIGFSRDQQIKSYSFLDCPSGEGNDGTAKEENTEIDYMQRVIEVDHAYGKTNNFSEIQVIDDSATDSAEETEEKTLLREDIDDLNEQEEIIIIQSLCEEKNKQDKIESSCEEKRRKDRIGYNNPHWLRKKIEKQKMQMKLYEERNMDLRCKIIEMKVSLGFKGKNIKSSFYAKAPTVEYPGFQEMLKQAAIQQLDKDAAINAIFRSVDEVKLKNYDSAFKKWLQFCSDNNVNIFEPEISEVLEFFKAVLAPGTMNYHGFVVYEKAILGILGEEKASDTRLKQFLQGLNDLLTTFKRQNCSWDPHVLLLYLSKQFPNEDIGLDELSRKVVTLLALVTKVGLQSFVEVKLEDVTVTEKEVQIAFADYSTGSDSKGHRTIVQLPFFAETPQLCIASTLAHYLERTSEIRPPNEESLFIEFEFPYSAASITTLNRWIRENMMRAGIEFSMFSDLLANINSLKDYQNEILFDEIKRRVKWTDDMLIFTHFYNI